MQVTVYFATDRVIHGAPDQVGSYTTGILPPSATNLTYGTAFVDGIDIASNGQGRITSIQETAQGTWPPDAAGDLSDPGENILLFIHGFDNSFSDAITRAAFNREWLAASGATDANTKVVAFSWPSLGAIAGWPIPQEDYLRDQQSARLSGLHLMTFFSRLEPILTAARARRRRSFLLTHSMGNLALESAVENWFAHGNGDATLFDVAVLAAADCGYASFNQPNLARLSGLSRLAPRVAVYFSRGDQVLLLSTVINEGAQRLGSDGPKDRSNGTTFPAATYHMVDASAVRDYDYGFLNSHQYYRMSPSIRTMIANDVSG